MDVDVETNASVVYPVLYYDVSVESGARDHPLLVRGGSCISRWQMRHYMGGKRRRQCRARKRNVPPHSSLSPNPSASHLVSLKVRHRPVGFQLILPTQLLLPPYFLPMHSTRAHVHRLLLSIHSMRLPFHVTNTRFVTPIVLERWYRYRFRPRPVARGPPSSLRSPARGS